MLGRLLERELNGDSVQQRMDCDEALMYKLPAFLSAEFSLTWRRLLALSLEATRLVDSPACQLVADSWDYRVPPSLPRSLRILRCSVRHVLPSCHATDSINEWQQKGDNACDYYS